MAWVTPIIAQTTGLVQFNGGGTQYLVQTPTGVLYCVYVDTGSDVAFRKSTNGGITWGNPTVLYTGTVTAHAIWYDRWSNIAAGLIHCAYIDSAVDDILYKNIDTENSDALSAGVTVFAGGTTAAGGALSITRARGGNLVIAGSIDAGSEDGAWESTDTGASWASAIADPSEAATQDQYLLLPGWNADNQDVQLIFWDASANELSVKRYDNSANSWAEAVIATGMTDQVAATAFPHFAAAVDITNSQNLVVAWTAVDTGNADLRCWKITDAAITETSTNVVLNSTDDQGLCGIGIDTTTGYWWVCYGGKSDGSETFLTSINVYLKVSRDGGVTWDTETKITDAGADITWLVTCPRYTGSFVAAWHNDIALDELRCSTWIPDIGSSMALGVT